MPRLTYEMRTASLLLNQPPVSKGHNHVEYAP